MVILAPDGKSLADRVMMPMTAAQVRWFCDPDSLLQNVQHLWALKLRLFCVRCWKKQLVDSIRVTFNDTTQTYTAACACARVPGRLPRGAVTGLSSTDELLKAFAWSFCCTGRCAKESGFADGVQAWNDPTGSRWSVTCGCTERVYLVPSSAASLVQ